jgi:hypothetical protein
MAGLIPAHTHEKAACGPLFSCGGEVILVVVAIE